MRCMTGENPQQHEPTKARIRPLRIGLCPRLNHACTTRGVPGKSDDRMRRGLRSAILYFGWLLAILVLVDLGAWLRWRRAVETYPRRWQRGARVGDVAPRRPRVPRTGAGGATAHAGPDRPLGRRRRALTHVRPAAADGSASDQRSFAPDTGRRPDRSRTTIVLRSETLLPSANCGQSPKISCRLRSLHRRASRLRVL